MQEVQKFVTKNNEEILLRPAVSEDAAEIVKTIRSTSLERSYVLMDQYGKDIRSEKDFIATMDRGKNLLIVALFKEHVVGYLNALQADGGRRAETAHVLAIGLHLDEAYRGHGIGSQMLRYATEWAYEHGYRKLEASIFTDNKRSLHLFSNAGFCEECIKKKRIRIGTDYIDEICMGKFLE